MTDKWQREQEISDWLTAQQDAVRQFKRQQNAEIRFRNAKIIRDYENYELFWHVFYDYNDHRPFVLPNRIAPKGEVDFRTAVRSPKRYFHAVVQGKVRAHHLCIWLIANQPQWRDVPGVNVIELAFGSAQ